MFQIAPVSYTSETTSREQWLPFYQLTATSADASSDVPVSPGW